jgi:hypothetical protein
VAGQACKALKMEKGNKMGNVTTRITIDKQVPGFWRVTLNHPPINRVDESSLWSATCASLGREKAVFGQPEVGFGLIAGGGALARLPLLVGRARAIEITLGGDDFDAETAERYGWINRAIPDAELDGFVANFVRRILSMPNACRHLWRRTRATHCRSV